MREQQGVCGVRFVSLSLADPREEGALGMPAPTCPSNFVKVSLFVTSETRQIENKEDASTETVWNLW